MKRLWLTWDGDKATGVLEGRIWEVELEEGFSSAFLRGINLKAGDEIIRLIASDADQDSDHGEHPQWIDCWRAVVIDDFDDAMTHAGQAMSESVGQAAVDFFRNEIREHGIMRHIFPPEAVTTAAEERARQMVTRVGSRDDILQGVRRMQEAGRATDVVSESAEPVPVHMYGPF